MTAEKLPGLIVIGAGGHAKVIIDIIEKQGQVRVACIVDDNPALKGTSLLGYPVAGMQSELLAIPEAGGLDCAVIAIGNNDIRARAAAWLRGHGYSLVTVIHPSAQVGRNVTIGAGGVLMAGTVINPDTRIGENVIVNTGATVDHDCIVGKEVHVAPGSHICGGVSIGDGTLVGAGSVVVPNIRIGKNVTIGAGSTVIRDVPDNAKIAGTPARKIS